MVPLLDPDISSTNSLGGIAPGKASSGPGERHKVRSAIFSRQARSMRPRISAWSLLALWSLVARWVRLLCNSNFEATSFYSTARCQRGPGGKRLLHVQSFKSFLFRKRAEVWLISLSSVSWRVGTQNRLKVSPAKNRLLAIQRSSRG